MGAPLFIISTQVCCFILTLRVPGVPFQGLAHLCAMWVGFWVHCQCEVVVFVHKVFLCILLFSLLFSVGLLPFLFWLLWRRHVSLAGFPCLGLALIFRFGCSFTFSVGRSLWFIVIVVGAMHGHGGCWWSLGTCHLSHTGFLWCYQGTCGLMVCRHHMCLVRTKLSLFWVSRFNRVLVVHLF